MVYSSPVDSKLVGSDDEETVVNVANPPAVEPITEKNNSRKKIIPIGIAIFVVVGSATALLVHSNRPTKRLSRVLIYLQLWSRIAMSQKK